GVRGHVRRYIWFPWIVTVTGVSGRGGGPDTTVPSSMRKTPGWQGQPIFPSCTVLTRQPACVHAALKALNVPAAGWVTTTLAARKTFPPPTGTWAVGPSARTVPAGRLFAVGVRRIPNQRGIRSANSAVTA